MTKAWAAMVVVLAAMPGCARLTPAGFWTTYRASLISDRFSDQGPWGGTRWVLWASGSPGTFKTDDVMKFAGAHGWTCTRLGDVLPDVQELPRHIREASSVYTCKTGWIRVDPGTGISSDALGYVQIDKTGRRMAIYHLWGEL